MDGVTSMLPIFLVREGNYGATLIVEIPRIKDQADTVFLTLRCDLAIVTIKT